MIKTNNTKLISKHSLYFILIGLIVFSNNTLRAQEKSLMLFDFETALDEGVVKPQDAAYEIIKTNDGSKLKVNSGYAINLAGVKLYRTKNNDWDLTDYYQIKADVSNLSNKDIQVELFVGNDPDGLIRWYCSDYADLEPQETKTITVNLSWTPWVHDPQQDIVGMRGIPGEIKTDMKAIGEFLFNTRYATSPSTFTVDNIRAVGKMVKKSPEGFFPFVDQFGQYKHKDWKNKIHTDKDLKVHDSLETIELAKYPSPEDLSIYGGWTKGPKLKATGFFRTEKYEDKWWMVDPEGYLFWTAGLNCVSSSEGNTGIEHRETYFENIAKNEGAYKKFHGTSTWATHGFYKGKTPYKTYNFYQSNLYKKYGDDWLAKFRNRVHDRFRSWGLNTIGFVSDFEAAFQHRTPYVGSIWITGTPKIEGSGGFWGKFHDVFDPSFRTSVRSSMNRQQKGAKDPWCIGFFIDNEMSWGRIGSLSIGALKSPATQPAKIEFINQLKEKYKSIRALNKVWKTKHKSWNKLLESTTPPDQKNAEEDLVRFYERIATTYFKTIKEELNRIAPGQNYLGCRFAWSNNDITLTAAAKYCDIVSFNKYEVSVEKVGLPEGVDKPIMIGEFHFGATDRGLAHPGVKASKNQQERANAYQSYIQGALRNKLIVGAHWFQYLDEPFTGRGDGENYNVGFVDVGDTPYEELISKVRETLYTKYQYRKDH